MYFDPEKITFFARTDARGKNVPFGIKAKDRQRHVYVIGKTGMGKSTLLENMALQDIQNGEGMAFIDPHGSAVETLLNYVPEHRIQDVLYFAPADASHPISFNVMEDVGPDKRHLVVSGLMSVFKKIWVDAWSARMEYILQNTILALLEYPESTLVGVNRMLSDKAYRDLVVNNVKDPSVRAFWVDEFAKYNERYMQEAGDAIKNKIGQFTANPIIRNIIGQPKSSFDIREMMDNRKILLINLSKGLIGESNANLLGSMLTTRIYLAAMSRADLSPEKMKTMPNFYFYVDEFQSFANATFANILSEARKYHLNLTIAHQYIEQMEEDVRSAVFGNVGTIISFRVGPFDAEVLETIFSPQFLAPDIVNLGFTQIYLTLMIDGIGSPPFSATSLPPISPKSVSYKDMVIAASRTRYARTRAAVEADIIKFHEPVIVVKPERADRPPRVEEGMRTAPRTAPGERPRERRTGAPTDERRAPRPQEGGVRPRTREGGERGEGPPRERERERVREERTEERREPAAEAARPRVAPVQPRKVDANAHLSELRSLLKKVVTEEQGQAPAPGLRRDERSGIGETTVREAEDSSPSPNGPPGADSPAESPSDAPDSLVPREREPDLSDIERVPAAEERGWAPEEATLGDDRKVLEEETSPLQPPPPRARAHRHESTPEQAQGVPEHTVTAREVSRMMRITGNDKRPF